MFKVNKRKRPVPKSVRVAESSASEEEESSEKESQIDWKKKKTHRKQQHRGLSFVDTNERNDEDVMKPRMGFGGLKQDEEVEGISSDEEELQNYGQHHLNQLRAAQKSYLPPTLDETTSETNKSSSINDEGELKPDREQESISKADLEDEVIVAGDEAFEYVEEVEKDHPQPTVTEPTIEDEEQAAHEEEWETQVASRGGFHKTIGGVSQKKIAFTDTIEDRMETFHRTIQKLENSRQELSSKIQRNLVEKSQFENLIQEKLGIQQKLEKSLTYYQQFLLKLSPTIDKLRDIQDKIKLIAVASHNLARERLQMKLDWADELVKDSSVSSSTENDVLEQIPQIDEFGRDVGISYTERERVGRWKQRLDTWDALISSTASSDTTTLFEKGRLLFQMASSNGKNSLFSAASEGCVQALLDAVAITSKEDDPTINSLASLFYEWQTTQQLREDYHNCYADDSFVQLASVLVQRKWLSQYISAFLTASCDDNNPCDFNTEFKSYLELKDHPMMTAVNAEEKNNNKPFLITRILHSTILPEFLSIMKDEYDPTSDEESQWVSSIFQFLTEKQLETDKEQKTDLIECVLSSLKTCIEKIHIPVIIRSNQVEEKNDDNIDGCNAKISEGSHLFPISQLYRLQSFTTNVCNYWLPVLLRVGSCTSENDPVSITSALLKNAVVDRLIPGLEMYLNDKNESYYLDLRKLLLDTMNVIEKAKNAHACNKDFLLWAVPLYNVVLSACQL